MLIRASYEDLFFTEQVDILGMSKSKEEMEELLCNIYACTGVISSCKSIIAKVSQSTFTKSGEYTIFLIASQLTGKVYLHVDANEIRGSKDIYYELPDVAYKPKFLGLLGFRVFKK